MVGLARSVLLCVVSSLVDGLSYGDKDPKVSVIQARKVAGMVTLAMKSC